MPVTTSYPGVYVEELPSSVHTVTGVATSNAAFVDFFPRGPMNKAVKVGSFREFERNFGGLDRRSEASYGIMQYFNNGGSEAFVVRVAAEDTALPASLVVEVTGPSLDDTMKDAKTHADNADQAAKDAKGVKITLGKDAAAAKALAAAVTEVAKDTTTAATETQAVGEAAQRAGEELAIVLQKDLAAGGALAQEASDKADAAKQAAAGADQQAKAAAAAAHAAEEAKIAANAVEAAADGPDLVISAADPGVWGNSLRITVKSNPIIPKGASARQFDFEIEEVVVHRGVPKTVRSEAHRNLTLDENASNYAVKAVNHDSGLVQIEYRGIKAGGAFPVDVDPPHYLGDSADDFDATLGTDGEKAPADQFNDGMEQGLDHIAPDVFNILCLPAAANYDNSGEAKTVYTAALEYCQKKRAFLLIDPPSSEAGIATIDGLVKDIQDWSKPYRGAANYSGAIYFPRLTIPDPLHGYRPRNVAPSGAVAGIYARTDASRGVWKTPAGIEAGILGADPAVKLRDEHSGILNPLGINVLRSFPVYGNVVWGGRTLAGADQMSSQWKYLSVRRLADFIEESLIQSLKWVVFEPNDEATWGQIRVEVGSFLAGLFADGAFVGETPDKGYLVKVDDETTTWLDIEQGRVNIIVGFAPAKPAEFVILEIQQLAGQTAS